MFRVGRIISAQVRADPFERPAGFELAAFWAEWSREFMATRPRLPVRLRASPPALAILPEVLGDYARDAIEAAEPPDEQGWRALVLSFEHERAAAHRLAGFAPWSRCCPRRPCATCCWKPRRAYSSATVAGPGRLQG